MRGALRFCHNQILERNGSVRGQCCERHMPLPWHHLAASPAKPIKASKKFAHSAMGMRSAPRFCRHQILARDGSVRGQFWRCHIRSQVHKTNPGEGELDPVQGGADPGKRCSILAGKIGSCCERLSTRTAAMICGDTLLPLQQCWLIRCILCCHNVYNLTRVVVRTF